MAKYFESMVFLSGESRAELQTNGAVAEHLTAAIPIAVAAAAAAAMLVTTPC